MCYHRVPTYYQGSRWWGPSVGLKNAASSGNPIGRGRREPGEAEQYFFPSVNYFFPTKGAFFPDPLSFFPHDISKFRIRHETRRCI